MFEERTITELKKVIGFRDHWNAVDIPALPIAMSSTESGQYYQDFHPLVRLDYIEALLPSDYPLETFLDDVETSAIKQMLNRLQTIKKLNNSGMDLARNNLIYDNVLKNKPIVNEGRFVGVEFSIKDDSIGIRQSSIESGYILRQFNRRLNYICLVPCKTRKSVFSHSPQRLRIRSHG